jgi:hypothetical protein
MRQASDRFGPHGPAPIEEKERGCTQLWRQAKSRTMGVVAARTLN